MKPYFVLLNHPKHQPVPMVDDSGDLVFFETDFEAKEAAFDNPLGFEFGFEIFELGGGLYFG